MMNSMLSMERAQGFQPSLFVTKRLCLSSLFSVGFLALLGGVLLGRYSFQRAFKLQSLVNVDKGDENFPELTHDAVPFVIEEIRASDLQQYITSLNVEPSDDLSSDLKQARILWQHFKDQGLDIVSHIHESSILLTFASRDLPSRASVAYVNFGRDTDFDYLESQQHILIANNIILARLGKVPPIILVDRALSRGALGVLLFADPEASLVTAERQLVTPAQLGLMQALHGDPSTPDKQAVVHGENNAKLECVPVEVISPESAEQIVR
ncbi:unnamed protein product, partial [Timema podura]|nr:unnamed protein product [Timema podura]